MQKTLKTQVNVLVFIIFLLFPFCAFTQTAGGLIKGRVIDAGGTPLVNISLRLKHLKKTVITDKEVLRFSAFLRQKILYLSQQLASNNLPVKSSCIKMTQLIWAQLNLKMK